MVWLVASSTDSSAWIWAVVIVVLIYACAASSTRRRTLIGYDAGCVIAIALGVGQYALVAVPTTNRAEAAAMTTTCAPAHVSPNCSVVGRIVGVNVSHPVDGQPIESVRVTTPIVATPVQAVEVSSTTADLETGDLVRIRMVRDVVVEMNHGNSTEFSATTDNSAGVFGSGDADPLDSEQAAWKGIVIGYFALISLLSPINCGLLFRIHPRQGRHLFVQHHPLAQ